MIDIAGLLLRDERETLELKETFVTSDVLEAICALANHRGGHVLIGVRDNKTIRGVTIGKGTLEQWANDIKLGLQILPSIDTQSFQGQTIGIICVEKQHTSLVNYQGRFFKRVGRTNQKLNYEDIVQHARAAYILSWDGEVEDGAQLKHLDSDAIEKFLEKVRSENRHSLQGDDPIAILKKIDLIKSNKPTRAAILLFAKQPQAFYPNAFIKLGRFKSKSTIIDDKEFKGTLFNQIEEGLDWIKNRLSTGLVIKGAPSRSIKWEYPLEAIREAIANAICHRDYKSESAVQAKLYDDKLEILNPGGLPAELTVDDLFVDHESVPRNRKVHEALYYSGIVERWGSGTIRMAEALAAGGLPKPQFESTRKKTFKVLFRKYPFPTEQLVKLNLNNRQLQLVIALQDGQDQITNQLYQERFSVSKRTATRELLDLVQLRILVKHGTVGAGVFYKLNMQ